MIDGVFVIGLTGSIGMGKTTTAGFFADEGIPVWDADAAVHRLYGPGGPAAAPISEVCPAAVSDAGVDRAALKTWIAQDDTAIETLNQIVHPLVGADRAVFLKAAAANGSPIVVVDVPLLFEGGNDRMVDAVVVVSAPEDIQRQRVLDRPGMTASHLDRILAQQLPDTEKRRRADYVIETTSLDDARRAVQDVVATIRAGLANHA